MPSATAGAATTPSTPPRSGAGCSPPGPTPRPASGRTPTPRRTWSAVATATDCWSSWRRTPPTRPLRAGVPGRLRLELAGDTLLARPTPAPRWTPGECRGWPRCARRPSATRPAASAGSASASPRSWPSATSPRSCRRRAACGSAPRRRGRRSRPFPVRRRNWPAGTARCPSSACPGRPRGRRRRGSRPRWCCRCGPGARASVAAALDALPGELLLALPGLSSVEVVVDGRSRTLSRAPSDAGVAITDGGRTTVWHVAQRSGELPAELVADRPVEERERRAWTVTWAVPLDEEGRPRAAPRRDRSCTHRRRATSR